MRNWNVLVTTQHALQFRPLLKSLERYGEVEGSEFRNVLEMRVADSSRFLTRIARDVEADSELSSSIGRVIPVTRCFWFQSKEEFEARAREAVRIALPYLPGKKFHVRMHRRGFKGRISSQAEEGFLDRFLQDELAREGKEAAKIAFEDPDLIIVVETIGQVAGISAWSREDLQRFQRLLRLD